jgi:hypothetical protein
LSLLAVTILGGADRFRAAATFLETNSQSYGLQDANSADALIRDVRAKGCRGSTLHRDTVPDEKQFGTARRGA